MLNISSISSIKATTISANSNAKTEEENKLKPLYLEPCFGPNEILNKLHPEILELIISFVVDSRKDFFNFQLVNKLFLEASDTYIEMLFKSKCTEKYDAYKNGRQINSIISKNYTNLGWKTKNLLNSLIHKIFSGYRTKGIPYYALELFLLHLESQDIRKKIECLDKLEIFFLNNEAEDGLSSTSKSLIRLQDQENISPEQVNFIAGRLIYYMTQKSKPQFNEFVKIPSHHLTNPSILIGGEIIEACNRNDIQLVKVMIKSEMFPESSHALGLNIVHWAVGNKNLEFLKLFIDEKINLNRRDIYGHTPLINCFKNKEKQDTDFKMMKMLIEGGADISAVDGHKNTALSLASESGFLDIVEILIKHGADKNHGNFFLDTPAHIAAQHGHDNIIQLFWEDHEVDFGQENQSGHSVFHIAAKWGKENIVNILANRKFDTSLVHQEINISSVNRTVNIESKNKNKLSPLNSAAIRNYPEMLKLLLSLNADKESADKKGWRPLHHAANMGIIDNIDVLIEAQVCIDAKAEADNNHTPIMLATINGHVAAVEKLLPYSQFDPVSNAEDRAKLIALKKEHKLKPEIMSIFLRGNNQLALNLLGFDKACQVL